MACCRIYWGWIVCCAFLVLFTLSCGTLSAFIETVIPIRKETDIDYALLNFIGMFGSALPMLLAPVERYLHNWFSVRQQAIAGVLIATISVTVTEFIPQTITMLLVNGVFMGVAFSCTFNAPYLLLAQYFPYKHRRHVLATGIIACAFPLATLIYNPVTYQLIAAFGWRNAYRALGVILFVLGLPAAATFRTPRIGEVDLETNEDQLTTTADVNANTSPANSEEIPIIGDSQTIAAKPRRAATILLAILWFIVTLLKSIGYKTPTTTLV